MKTKEEIETKVKELEKQCNKWTPNQISISVLNWVLEKEEPESS